MPSTSYTTSPPEDNKKLFNGTANATAESNSMGNVLNWNALGQNTPSSTVVSNNNNNNNKENRKNDIEKHEICGKVRVHVFRVVYVKCILLRSNIRPQFLNM